MNDFDSLAKLDLNLLLSLVIVVETRSVSKAARHLCVSQSAMSHRLSKLRELLDDPLLVPAGNELVPTPLAERLASPLREQFGAMEHALRTRGHFEPASSERHFRIVGPEPLQAQLLPQLLAELGRRAPRVAVTLSSYYPGFLDDLEQRRIDFAVLPQPASRSAWMSARTVFEEDTVCLSADAAFAEGLDLERYLALDHVLVVNHLAGSSVIDSILASRGLERRIAARLSSFQAVPWLLRARPNLVWTTSSSIAHFACRVHPLTIAPPPFEIPTFRLSLAWHKRDDHDAGHVWFRECIEAAGSDAALVAGEPSTPAR
jgi:DNA-binding transcriptional LysR family regulator